MEPYRIEKIKALCNRFTDPIAIINSDLVCVYSNSPKLIPIDESVASLFVKPFTLPKEKAEITMALIKDCSYGVRVIPFEEDLYVCEFYGQRVIIKLAENTDIYGKIDPMITSIKRNTIVLRNELGVLKNKIKEYDCVEFPASTLNLEKALLGLDSVVSNTYEYTKMMHYTSTPKNCVELKRLATEIVARCNSILCSSGRYVDILCDVKEAIIKAESRFVINAVVNAIQNALLYSPHDDIPCLSISCVGPDDSYVQIRVSNKNIMFLNDELNEDTSGNFAFQRLGYGIPIIRRFAEISDGSFSISESNGYVCVNILIPVEKTLTDDRKKCVLNSSLLSVFKSDIPDILDIKMMEVNRFFLGR